MKNLNDLNPDQLRALARLKQIGGERILEVFEVFKLEGSKALVDADDMVRVHRLQGEVKAFQFLIDAVNEAAEIDARSDRV